ncbi:MAG: hypothetical protein BLM47_00765 [Candidatus Reconcilbacillus cellulovorans]|uniref:DUF2487 domain-containing protein n=1 Tax=Candidatus Reconcilbacillus cellulovorans TaxID=1906605 RepID=A0A2A6E3R6_9BACL|nr:MAG: hypothetical protein BLM47_00765 [Candidatus Reconcilbacillus cellulovorans]
MKFNEIDRDRWDAWRPYLDTCLLPVTGLAGDEPPWRAAEVLRRLRDRLEPLEIAFYGRTVTFPAFHYVFGESGGEDWKRALRGLCGAIRAQGFRYVVVVTDVSLAAEEVAADLVVGPSEGADWAAEIRRLWRGEDVTKNATF